MEEEELDLHNASYHFLNSLFLAAEEAETVMDT